MTTLFDLKLRSFAHFQANDDALIDTDKCDQEVIDYLEELIAKGLTYHFDDGVDDIDWSGKLTPDGIANILKNHDALMAYMDCRFSDGGIWEFLEDRPKLSRKYLGSDE